MRKEFKIISYSKSRSVFSLVVELLMLVPIIIFFLKYRLVGQIMIGVFAITFVALSFILPKYTAKALLLISVDAEDFQFDWIKSYWGSKAKQSVKFSLKELKSYKYESSYNFSTLKLRLKSGEKLKFHRWYNDSNDDFDKFMTCLKRAIENYNKKKSTVATIEKEKLIMENKSFLIIVGLIIVAIFITTIFLFIHKGVSNIKGIVPILIVLGPLIWVIIQVIEGLQKPRN